MLVDKPTGNLDRATADAVFEMMLELAASQGTAFVLVTHDRQLAARRARCGWSRDGWKSAHSGWI